MGASAVEVETKAVEVAGTGTSLKDAIADGLVEAIGQVAGRFIESESELKNMEVSATEGSDEKYFASQSFQDKIKSATKGAVKEYSILQQGKDDKGLWEVKLSVSVLKVIPGMANRKKIVCTTFGFPGQPKAEIFDLQAVVDSVVGADKPAREVAGAFTDNLEAYLVQSRKFMILDRRKTEAVAEEKNIVLTGNVTIETVLKMSSDDVADLVVVGGVESVDYVVTDYTMSSGRKVKVGEGFVEISFRVIDVPSRQVKYADRVRFTYADKDLKKLSNSFAINRAGNLMMSDAANRIGKQILEAIYPATVVAVSGEQVTLNEGGRGMAVGEIYDVYALGDELTDPVTKESLGRQEIPVGRIKITISNAKMSSGKVTEKTGEIVAGAICRLSKAAMEDEKAEPKAAVPSPGRKLKTDDLF